jgi:hypothetical protein
MLVSDSNHREAVAVAIHLKPLLRLPSVHILYIKLPAKAGVHECPFSRTYSWKVSLCASSSLGGFAAGLDARAAIQHGH